MMINKTTRHPEHPQPPPPPLTTVYCGCCSIAWIIAFLSIIFYPTNGNSLIKGKIKSLIGPHNALTVLTTIKMTMVAKASIRNDKRICNHATSDINRINPLARPNGSFEMVTDTDCPLMPAIRSSMLDSVLSSDDTQAYTSSYL